MKLYLISQDVNDGYDTYDSAVVAAESEEDARSIHPSPFVVFSQDGKWYGRYADNSCTRAQGKANEPYETENYYGKWVKADQTHLVEVEYLGETNRDRGVVCASFNAG